MCDGIQGKPSEVSVLNEKGETKSNAQSLWSWRWFGPGLLVCLADTDYGCLVVAGQDGAKWGYSLLPLQVVLVPVLFMAQELTVRLGIHTRKGHTACIRDHFGSFWAWTSCAVLVLECIGAIISQMTGVAAVVELWGGTQAVGVVLSSCTIVAVVVCCSYKQIETIGVVLGLFELVFVFTMFWMHPPPREVFTGMAKQHHESEYLKLFTANIGAVIMPWMIYFQQSAVVARRLTTGADMKEERTNSGGQHPHTACHDCHTRYFGGVGGQWQSEVCQRLCEGTATHIRSDSFQGASFAGLPGWLYVCGLRGLSRSCLGRL